MSERHLSTTYPNIVGPAFASSSKTIATFERNRSQHCWARLDTLLQHVAICCELKIEMVRMPRRNIVCCHSRPQSSSLLRMTDVIKDKSSGIENVFVAHETTTFYATSTNVAWKIWPFSNLNQQHPTCRDTVAINARNMLHLTMLRHAALKCCDRLAGA